MRRLKEMLSRPNHQIIAFFFFLHEEHRIYMRNIGKKPTPQETSTSSIFEVKQAYFFYKNIF
jgi:hypothetical protein